MNITVTLDARDHAIILAALRHAQDFPEALREHLSNNDERPTTTLELDEIAESFNSDSTIDS